MRVGVGFPVQRRAIRKGAGREDPGDLYIAAPPTPAELGRPRKEPGMVGSPRRENQVKQGQAGSSRGLSPQDPAPSGRWAELRAPRPPPPGQTPPTIVPAATPPPPPRILTA